MILDRVHRIQDTCSEAEAGKSHLEGEAGEITHKSGSTLWVLEALTNHLSLPFVHYDLLHISLY